MNAHARNPDLSELSLVDDADASRGAVEPEQDLASLPTLPRFSAKDLRPSTSAAANAPEMASPPMEAPLELTLEPIDERRPAPPPMTTSELGASVARRASAVGRGRWRRSFSSRSVWSLARMKSRALFRAEIDASSKGRTVWRQTEAA